MIEILKYLPLFLKYLPAILKGKDVASTYLADNGTEKPLLISRRVVGGLIGIIASAAGAISIYYGISIPDESIKTVIDSVVQMSALTASIYGVILSIIGDIKRTESLTTKKGE